MPKSIFFTTKQGLFTTYRIRQKQFLRYNISNVVFCHLELIAENLHKGDVNLWKTLLVGQMLMHNP